MINFEGGRRDDSIPKWERIYLVIKDRIESGQYAEGARIPSLRQMMQEFEASDGTIQKALRRLREEGVIRSRHGHGTFVRPREEWHSPDQ